MNDLITPIFLIQTRCMQMCRRYSVVQLQQKTLGIILLLQDLQVLFMRLLMELKFTAEQIQLISLIQLLGILLVMAILVVFTLQVI